MLYRFTRPVGSSVFLLPSEKDDDGHEPPIQWAVGPRSPVALTRYRLKTDVEGVVPIIQTSVSRRSGSRGSATNARCAVQLAPRPGEEVPEKVTLIVELG
jgi:hypothetical protein